MADPPKNGDDIENGDEDVDSDEDEDDEEYEVDPPMTGPAGTGKSVMSPAWRKPGEK